MCGRYVQTMPGDVMRQLFRTAGPRPTSRPPEGDDPARLLRPAPDDLLRFWLVSKAVNSPRNNGPELLAEQAAAQGEGSGPNPA